MPLFGSYVSLNLDKEAASRALNRKVRELFKIGIRAWVDEAKNVVPVWSGGERAALTQIAEYADVPVFGPGSNSRVTHTDVRDVARNVEERQEEGRASENFEVEQSTSKISFRWSSTLDYFNYNERFNANIASSRANLIDPGPYNMREQANNAWNEAVREQIAANPFRVRNVLRIRRFRLGG